MTRGILFSLRPPCLVRRLLGRPAWRPPRRVPQWRRLRRRSSELRQRNPNIATDICAGGGGRNDLEGLRRAVPLWRSDYPFEPAAMQDQTYGMALWIPYFGTAVNSDDPYVFRSQMVPAVGIGVEPSGSFGSAGSSIP